MDRQPDPARANNLQLVLSLGQMLGLINHCPHLLKTAELQCILLGELRTQEKYLCRIIDP